MSSRETRQNNFFLSNLKLRRAGYGHKDALLTENLIKIEQRIVKRTHSQVRLARRQLRQARRFFSALSRNMTSRMKDRDTNDRRGWKRGNWRFVYNACQELHQVSKQVYATLDPRSRFIENLEEAIPIVCKNFNPTYRAFRRKQIFTTTNFKFQRVVRRKFRRRLIPRTKKRQLRTLAEQLKLPLRSWRFKRYLIWRHIRTNRKRALRLRPFERRFLAKLPIPNTSYQSKWETSPVVAYRRNRLQVQPLLAGYSIQHGRVAARARRTIRLRLKVYKQIFYRKVYNWTLTQKRVEVKLSKKDRDDYLHYYLWNLGNITGVAREREWQALKSKVSLHQRRQFQFTKLPKFKVRTPFGMQRLKGEIVVPMRFNWIKIKSKKSRAKRQSRTRRKGWIIRVQKTRVKKGRKKVIKRTYYKMRKHVRLVAIKYKNIISRKWIQRLRRFKVKRLKGYYTREDRKVKLNSKQLQVPLLTFA